MSREESFELLSELLKPYAKRMSVKHDTDENYYLEETLSSDKPQMFGAVQIKKRYTSFHLFPVYCDPDLLKPITAELRKRMQGKSCFNFTKVEQIPEGELKTLIAEAFGSVSEGKP